MIYLNKKNEYNLSEFIKLQGALLIKTAEIDDPNYASDLLTAEQFVKIIKRFNINHTTTQITSESVNEANLFAIADAMPDEGQNLHIIHDGFKAKFIIRDKHIATFITFSGSNLRNVKSLELTPTGIYVSDYFCPTGSDRFSASYSFFSKEDIMHYMENFNGQVDNVYNCIANYGKFAAYYGEKASTNKLDMYEDAVFDELILGHIKGQRFIYEKHIVEEGVSVTHSEREKWNKIFTKKKENIFLPTESGQFVSVNNNAKKRKSYLSKIKEKVEAVENIMRIDPSFLTEAQKKIYREEKNLLSLYTDAENSILDLGNII